MGVLQNQPTLTHSLPLQDSADPSSGNRLPIENTEIGDQSDCCLFIDSPMPNAVSQILPFFEQGFFDAERTRVLVRSRPRYFWSRKQKTFGLPDVHHIPLRQVSLLPVPDGTVIFYPYNAISNMNAVSNRAARHVLILHGESNKAASSRPAARLYDYVVIAGSLAWDRYYRSSIFSQHDLELGRVLQMGDTFVQTAPWLRSSKRNDEAWFLYAPTWEGGVAWENYSSLRNGAGFEMAATCANELGLRKILIKLHPNTGERDKSTISHILQAISNLEKKGMEVAIIDDCLNWKLRLLLNLHGTLTSANTAHPVRAAIVDVSGMEAICLKHKIPHLVLQAADNQEPNDALKELYRCKGVNMDKPAIPLVHQFTEYYTNNVAIDDAHRQLVFGWATPELAKMAPSQRREWLCSYIKKNEFWKR